MGNDCFKKKLKKPNANKIKLEKICVVNNDTDHENTDVIDLKILKDQSERIHHISEVLETIQNKVNQMETTIDQQITLKTPIINKRRLNSHKMKKE